MKKKQNNEFNYTKNFDKTDFRKNPELYRIGKGEEGVLLVEPYKSEILPHWRFKTPEIAEESSGKIYKMFLEYLEKGDYVGADMARKYLQRGYTRARRYVNHKTGKKYKGAVPDDKKGQSGAHGRKELPLDPDPVKARSAEIFKEKWQQAKSNSEYAKLKEKFISTYSS